MVIIKTKQTPFVLEMVRSEGWRQNSPFSINGLMSWMVYSQFIKWGTKYTYVIAFLLLRSWSQSILWGTSFHLTPEVENIQLSWSGVKCIPFGCCQIICINTPGRRVRQWRCKIAVWHGETLRHENRSGGWIGSTAKIYYSRTSIGRTPMARLPWLIRTRFWVPTKFFKQLKKTNI